MSNTIKLRVFNVAWQKCDPPHNRTSLHGLIITTTSEDSVREIMKKVHSDVKEYTIEVVEDIHMSIKNTEREEETRWIDQ